MQPTPCTRPMPAIIPAPGASPSYIACAASWPISRNGVPGSSSWFTRSRGSSLPRAVCLSRAASPPPCAASATFALRSATSVRIAAVLARNSSERGSIWLFSTCMAASRGFCEELAADQHPPDLGRARTDLVQLGIAPQALDRELLRVAHAAQRLDRLAGHPGRLLGRVEDGAGRVLAQRACVVGTIAGLAHRIDVRAAGLPGGVHVGQLALHQLELTDALAELLALVHIRQHRVHARGHDA